MRVWDLAHKRCVTHTYGHARIVTGVTFAEDGQTFFSCGDDNYIKQWALHADVAPDGDDVEEVSWKPAQAAAGMRVLTLRRACGCCV